MESQRNRAQAIKLEEETELATFRMKSAKRANHFVSTSLNDTLQSTTVDESQSLRLVAHPLSLIKIKPKKRKTERKEISAVSQEEKSKVSQGVFSEGHLPSIIPIYHDEEDDLR
jgi:hypothetical protein